MDCSEKQKERWDNCLINQKEETIISESYVAQNKCIITYYKNQVALFRGPQMQTEQQKKKTYHRTHTEGPEKHVVLKILNDLKNTLC